MNQISNPSSPKKNQKAIKVLLVMIAACLSSLVFGLFIPFTLIAFKIIPHLGITNIVYLILGSIVGLLFGSISSSNSLFKSDKIVSLYYIRFMAFLVITSILYFLCYALFPEAYSHI